MGFPSLVYIAQFHGTSACPAKFALVCAGNSKAYAAGEKTRQQLEKFIHGVRPTNQPCDKIIEYFANLKISYNPAPDSGLQDPTIKALLASTMQSLPPKSEISAMMPQHVPEQPPRIPVPTPLSSTPLTGGRPSLSVTANIPPAEIPPRQPQPRNDVPPTPSIVGQRFLNFLRGFYQRRDIPVPEPLTITGPARGPVVREIVSARFSNFTVPADAGLGQAFQLFGGSGITQPIFPRGRQNIRGDILVNTAPARLVRPFNFGENRGFF